MDFLSVEEKEAAEQMIKKLFIKLPPNIDPNGLIAKREKRLRLVGTDPGVIHLRTVPVFEVSSVTVHSIDKLVADGKPCEIYGVIGAVDEDNNTYVLYQRRRNDAEKILLGNSISLDDWPFSPSKPLKVLVHLMERVRDVQIANGVFNVDYESKDDYDRCKVERIEGECGFATLRHITYQSALMAMVYVGITKLDDDGEDYVHIYGTISACAGKYYQNKFDEPKESYILFERKPEEYTRVMSRGLIELSRSVVAVPAYSSICLLLDLWECDTKCKIAYDKIECKAAERGRNSWDIKGEKTRVTVELKWRHPDELFDDKINLVKADVTDDETEECKIKEHAERDLWSSLDSSLSFADNKLESTNVIHMTKKMPRDSSMASTVEEKHSGSQQHVEPSLLLGYPLPITDTTIYRMTAHPVTNPLVEVFSVLVDTVNHDCLGIHGKVRVHNKMGTSFIFNKDDKHPEVLSQECQVLPTVRPNHNFICKSFRIDVRLWDDKGRIFCKGFMKWGRSALNTYIAWPDKRICSIIRGEHGFAAVHYTIFSSGAQALLKVLFFTKDSSEVGANVCGSIVAQYSNYDYSTYYDREFFQSVLFKEHSQTPVHVGCGSEVPLSKCVVSTPLGSSLVVKIDLAILPNMGSKCGVVNLQGIAEFKPFYNHVQRIDADNGGHILVHVDWNGVDGAEASSAT